MIYLDNAATTFPKPNSVYETMDRANRELAFNAGRGSYKVARKATQLIDETKALLLELVGGKGIAEVVFSPSITIALNQILCGIEFVSGDNIYVSPYEHNAVARTVHLLEKEKCINVIEMPLKEETLEIDIEQLKYSFMKHPPKCVCCIHVSNVTGYILPVTEVFEIAKQYDAINVLDTAQSLGLVDVNLNQIYVDFIAFAGHKTLYGPFGIGGFITTGKVKLKEYIVGGTGSDSLNLDMPEGYPAKYESSSANIVAIAGLNAALKEINVEESFVKEKELTGYLVKKMQELDDVILYLPPPDKHIGIVSFNIEGYKSEDVGMILDEDYDIAVRTGYHCAPYVHRHLKSDEYVGTVRVGMGRCNDTDEIDEFVLGMEDIIQG